MFPSLFFITFYSPWTFSLDKFLCLIWTWFLDKLYFSGIQRAVLHSQTSCRQFKFRLRLVLFEWRLSLTRLVCWFHFIFIFVLFYRYTVCVCQQQKSIFQFFLCTTIDIFIYPTHSPSHNLILCRPIYYWFQCFFRYFLPNFTSLTGVKFYLYQIHIWIHFILFPPQLFISM